MNRTNQIGVFSASISDMIPLLGTARQPLIIDVQRQAAFAANPRLICGAIRRAPEDVADWVAALPKDQDILVYCVHGHEVGKGACGSLNAAGRRARYLEGGIEAWLASSGPSLAKTPQYDGGKSTIWVTRERPKIDRIACPWLIRRFIDPLADIVYVPAPDVLKTAERLGGIPFDIPGVAFSHVGEKCSFDAFVEKFDIRAPGLGRLAAIVRGADTSKLDLTRESAGLYALSLGLCDLHQDDRVLLAEGMKLYDALYRWCRDLQGEAHAWPPKMSA
jgi:rhodanese-related sulfurtransferase